MRHCVIFGLHVFSAYATKNTNIYNSKFDMKLTTKQTLFYEPIKRILLEDSEWSFCLKKKCASFGVDLWKFKVVSGNGEYYPTKFLLSLDRWRCLCQKKLVIYGVFSSTCQHAYTDVQLHSAQFRHFLGPFFTRIMLTQLVQRHCLKWLDAFGHLGVTGIWGMYVQPKIIPY